MQVTRHITDLLLKSVDVMRDMLRAVQHKTPIDAQRVADLQFDLELAIVQKNAAPAAAAAPAPAPRRLPAAPATRSDARIAGASSSVRIRSCSCTATIRCACCASWRISAISTSVVDCAERCPRCASSIRSPAISSWDLTVDTDATREVIDQVFDWAEGDCELKIRDENARGGRVAQRHAANAVAVVVAETQARPKRRAAAPPPDAGEAPKQGLGDGSSIRVSTEKIDELMNTVGELVITQSMLTQLGTKLDRRPSPSSCAPAWRSSSATCASCRKASCACACCRSASCSAASRAWCAT